MYSLHHQEPWGFMANAYILGKLAGNKKLNM